MNTGIVAVTVIAGGTTALRVLYDGRVSDKPAALFKVAIGIFALGALLSLVASGAPNVASAIGALIAVASLFINADALALAARNLFGV